MEQSVGQPLPKVLFVDDEKDNLDALRRLFRKTYDCHFAQGGVEAIKILATHSDLAVIVSDQRMPEMTGVQLFEKCLALIPDAVRVMITGYSDIEAVIDSINSGRVYAYISKPWEPEELKLVLHQAVDHYRLHQELKSKNMALEQALRELEQLDQAKSRFLSLLGHELRTPLTVLVSYIQALEAAGPADSGLIAKSLGRFKESTQRLNSLVEDSLLLAQALLKKVPVDPLRPPNLLNLQSLTEMIQKATQRRPRAVALTMTPRILVPPTLAYSDSGMQVLSISLTKVLDNAIKHATSEIQVSLYESQQNTLCLLISDDGPGIPADIQAQLFHKWGDTWDLLHHTQGIGLGLKTALLFLEGVEGKLQIVNKIEDLPLSSYGPPQLGLLRGANFLIQIPAFQKLDLT